jgi:hypothetical protein
MPLDMLEARRRARLAFRFAEGMGKSRVLWPGEKDFAV